MGNLLPYGWELGTGVLRLARVDLDSVSPQAAPVRGRRHRRRPPPS
jgi:hypothetical protein